MEFGDFKKSQRSFNLGRGVIRHLYGFTEPLNPDFRYFLIGDVRVNKV